MLRLKYCLSAVSQGWSPQCEDIEAGEGEWGVLKAGCVNHGVFRPSENKRLPADVEPPVELEVAPGDLLVSRANTRQLLGCAALVTASSARLLLCDKLYRIVTRADVVNQRYLARAFASAWVRHQLERDATGTSDSMQNTSQQSIRELELPMPRPEDQRAIADFLDRETERIDALVAKKQRLIELLREKRTALISHAVTKGLDPDAPMKDASPRSPDCVPWHWAVLPLKRIADLRYGLGQPPAARADGIPIVRATDISRGAIAESGMLRVDPADVPRTRDAFLTAGEIIIVRSGAYTGDSAIVPPHLAGCVAGYDMVVRVRQGYPSFLGWHLLAEVVRVAQWRPLMMRAAQPHLNVEDLPDTRVCCPPLDEQRGIVQHLSEQTARLDALRQEERHLIDLLREYRSALITAAVTGQIDVSSREARRQAEGL